MRALVKHLYGEIFSAKFAKYLLNASLSYPLILIITYVLTEHAGLYYLYSYLLSLFAAVIVNFTLSMKWIFKVQGRVPQKFVRYLIVLASFGLANTLIVKFVTEYLRIYYLVSITLVSATMFVLKYLTYKRKVFEN